MESVSGRIQDLFLTISKRKESETLLLSGFRGEGETLLIISKLQRGGRIDYQCFCGRKETVLSLIQIKEVYQSTQKKSVFKMKGAKRLRSRQERREDVNF